MLFACRTESETPLRCPLVSSTAFLRGLCARNSRSTRLFIPQSAIHNPKFLHPDTTARRLSAIAYDPGHTPGTDLVRNENFAIKFLWKSLAPALRLTLRGSNTPEAAGECLAKLALGQTRPPSGRIYAALRSGTITWPEPSELALRDDLRDALWRDSSVLVGLSSAG